MLTDFLKRHGAVCYAWLTVRCAVKLELVVKSLAN